MKAQARCLLPHLALPWPFFLPFDSRRLPTVRAYDCTVRFAPRR
jgi:hypothetical protein